ncbi:MAG TPA: LuxR C-terminal-related transcriptional regulator [Solirubrobacteraceae bacterium]|jgi:PAS domain S-box-containing protein
MPAEAGWRTLFREAFRRSRNPMVLLDEGRCHVDVNGAYLQLVGYPRPALIGRPVYELVIGGPLMTPGEWRALLGQSQFTAVADLRRQDGGQVTVELAGHPAVVDGKPLVLFVVIASNRRGRRPSSATTTSTPIEKLTDRELDVVHLIALGASGPEIANELQVAHNTVRTHTRNAMSKTGARSRAHLVAIALAEVLPQEASRKAQEQG